MTGLVVYITNNRMSDLSISSCISKLWPCVFSQDCPSKQDLQNSIHQAHKLLSAQEASYLQSLRSLRKKLSLLQDNIARRPAKAKNCKSHIRPKAKLHHVVNSQQYSVLKVSVFYIPQLLVLTWMLLSMEESWARFCFQVMKCTSGAMRALSWWVQRLLDFKSSCVIKNRRKASNIKVLKFIDQNSALGCFSDKSLTKKQQPKAFSQDIYNICPRGSSFHWPS